MLRKIGLHQHFSGQVATAGASRDLLEQREQPLGRPELAAVQRVVGAEDADQRQASEVVALGEHLRADHDVDLAGVDRIAHGRETSPAARAVPVDAQYPRRRI